MAAHARWEAAWFLFPFLDSPDLPCVLHGPFGRGKGASHASDRNGQVLQSFAGVRLYHAGRWRKRRVSAHLRLTALGPCRRSTKVRVSHSRPNQTVGAKVRKPSTCRSANRSLPTIESFPRAAIVASFDPAIVSGLFSCAAVMGKARTWAMTDGGIAYVGTRARAHA